LVATGINREFGRVDAKVSLATHSIGSPLFFRVFRGQLLFQKNNCHEKHKKHKKIREENKRPLRRRSIATEYEMHPMNPTAPNQPSTAPLQFIMQ
jgi:hypothetical protein